MFQGQIAEIPLLCPGKLGLFLILALFSTRPSQKLGTPAQLKTTFSNKYGTMLSSQKVSYRYIKNYSFYEQLYKDCFQLRFFAETIKSTW